MSWGEAELLDDRWPEGSADGQGHREQRSFIEISDNGVGMTFDIVRRFFTQIGQSYYQSQEYSHERALMKEFLLPVSEISQFGIGILSCFMLADLVEVWTCPSRADDDQRQPHHLRIWGPDGLFWHQPIKGSHDCGTRVRMWLRPGIVAQCQPDNLIDELRSYHFADRSESLRIYVATSAERQKRVDPLRAIWSVAAWPRYAIDFQPPTEEHPTIPAEVRLLNDVAVLKVLCPLSAEVIAKQHEQLSKQIAENSDNFGHGIPELAHFGPLTWRVWDWEDIPTASRIRLAVPVVGTEIERVASIVQLFAVSEATWPIDLLRSGLVETQLQVTGRTRWIVRGMAVPSVKPLAAFMEFGHGVGTCCVVDLSGHPAPGLKSDRTALKGTQRDDWLPELQQLLARWRAVVGREPTSFAVIRRAEHGTNWRLQIPLLGAADSTQWELPQDGPVVATRLLIQELATKNLYINTSGGRDLARALDLDLDRNLDLDRDRNLDLDGSRDLDLDRAQLGSYFLARDLALARNSKAHRVARSVAKLIATQWLSEGCYTDLRKSSSVLGLPIVEGEFVAGRLTATLAADFEMTRNTVRLLGGWSAPTWLNGLAYDLVAPFNLQPLGGLPQQVPDWGRDRALRVIALLPFLTARGIEFDKLRNALPKVGFPEEFVRFGSILLLIPGDSLLRLPFLDWDRERDDQHVVSALWDVPLDRVLWAEGFHDRDSIRKTGRPLDDWLKD